jgi:hypothetical protein
MGTNRRYPADGMEGVIDEIITRPAPVWLTDAELDLEHQTPIVPDVPLPAKSYVRFHEAVIQPEVEIVAWTARAVRIRFAMRNGQKCEGWVWKGAVTERDSRVVPPRR